MRQTKYTGSFLLCLLINLLLNLAWSIPGLVLLALHRWFGISIWWPIGALGLWILRVLAGMWFIGWAARCSQQEDPPKENKNPYSIKKKN